MTGSVRLPLQARHEACGRLIELGRYADALDLLNSDDPEDAAIGVRVSLLAADAVAARRFLATLEQTAVHPGLLGFLRSCTALTAGDGSALNQAGPFLSGGDATAQDAAIFAVAAARHNLHQAGVTAEAALDSGVAAPAVVPVLAAALAADGSYPGAFSLLKSASQRGIDPDPVPRTLALLRAHGHSAAAEALVALGVQVRGLSGTAPVLGQPEPLRGDSHLAP